MMVHCVYSFQIRTFRCVQSSQLAKSAIFPWRRYSTASDQDKTKKVVFLGTPDVAASSLRKLYEASKQEGSGYEIVSVITQPPKRRRRKGKLEPSPVGKVAEELELDILCPEKVRLFFILDFPLVA